MHADPLGDLRGTLQPVAPQGALAARVEVRTTSTNDDEGTATTAEKTATVDATLDASALRLAWPAAELERARRLAAEDRRNPDAPSSGGLAELGAEEAADLLDAAPGLLADLEGATLTEARAESWQGTPTRLLVITPRSPLSDKDKKRVKTFEDTLRIWVGTDGWPLALERTTHVKARVMLMGFTSDSSTKSTFGRAAGRLYVRSTTREGTGEGMGQKGGSRTTITVTPLPAAEP